MDSGLKIGDYITLRSSRFSAYLGAEGILFDGLVVHDRLSEFDDCIFAVHLQRQYSAAKELENFQGRYSISENDDEQDENTKKYLHALHRGYENEINLNDSYLIAKMGQPVHYGDVIQLFHVKSRKYILVNPKQLATSERENSRLSLDMHGNAYSWLRFMPRSRIDHEGDRIIANADCYVMIAERNNEFVHISDSSPKEGFDREVNCSMEKAGQSWRLGIYQNCTDAANKNVLLSSQLVYINDPETQSNLTVALAPVDSFDEEPQRVEEVGDKCHLSDYFHDFGDIITKPIVDGKENPASVWLLESRSFINGGPFQWKTEQVRFRNLVNGRYLAMISKEFTDDEGVVHTDHFLTTVNESGLAIPGSVFNAMEQVGNNNYLTKAKALTISSDNIFFERGVELENDNFSIKPTADKTKAVSLLINLYVPLSEIGAPEGAPRSLEPLDVHCGLAARKHIARFLNMIVIPSSSGVSTVWPSAGRDDLAFFKRIASQIMNFSQGFDASDTRVTLGIDKANQVLRVSRQYLLRELGVIEIVLRIIHKLIPITEKIDAGELTDAETTMTEMGSSILEKCFQIIYYCVLDNPEIQIYVATFLKVLLRHLSTQDYAGKCVTEMLSKNLELQETKIGVPEISIFVDSLRSSTMNSMYLNLLQCCCSCEGQGVDGNQCTVAETLFNIAQDVLLFLEVDEKDRSTTEWDEEGNSVYIQGMIQSEKLVHGINLLRNGLPALYLTWTTTKPDWSPRAIFGMDKVPLSTVFPPSSSFQSSSNLAKTRKNIVANYFINQMLLGAEMCMDRNYVAMHKLDPYFSFESLVTMLKRDDVNDDIKASAARLLLCLHVDRDPQAETKIPCLTRVWSVIQKDGAPQLPCVEPSHQNAYALIQELISEHVKFMAGKKWNSYSKYMLQMLLSLIKFNFYGSLEKMNQTIKPLIEAVDRRNCLFESLSLKRSNGNILRSESSMRLGTEKDKDSSSSSPVSKKVPWEKTTLDFFESLPMMLFILSLVLIAVAITIYQVIAEVEEEVGSPLYIWGLFVFIIFVIDYSTRFYCYLRVNGVILPFIVSPFNIIDALVISLDIVFLALPPDIGGSEGSFTKTLRLVRLARLLRIARAAKVVSAVVDEMVKKKIKPWIMPQRYLKCSADEVDTILQSLNVLLFIQNVIDDRNLSLLLRKFYKWIDGSTGKKTPGELLEQVVEESIELTLGVADFDNIFMDTLMYHDVPLVQSALDVIMAHNSVRQTLLRNASQVQLLVTPKREQQFKVIESMLRKLEQNAETHELWGELESESDHETNRQTKEVLTQLTSFCRLRCFCLEFDEDYVPEKEIQNLYRNLGCFTICLKMLGLLESVQEDENGELSDVARNTRELCLLTNQLLYWFFILNPKNQELGFSELALFIDSLDAEISSHRVIRAIFKDNEDLMSIVPLSLLTDMGEKMELKKSHLYLSLACSITNVGDKNMVNNQFEIVRTLTGPERFTKVVWGLVPITHPDYAVKRDLMAQAKDLQDPDMDDLPPLLAYHLTFLEALSNCTVGRLNITSIEAKIQSIYSLVDVVAAILEPDTILITKLRMTQFLLNAIVDVEMVIPGLCQSASMWRLLESIVGTLEYAKDDLRLVEKVGWKSPQVSRQKIEHIMTCIMLCANFFQKNYDSSKVKSEDGVSGADTVTWPMVQINGIVVSLFRMVKEIYDLDSPRLTVLHKGYIYDAMIALNNSALQPVIAGAIEATHLSRSDGDEEEIDADAMREREVHTKFAEFLQLLHEDEMVLTKARTENRHFISVVEALPPIDDLSIASDLRYEAVLRKLIRHVYANMSMSNGEKKLEPRCGATTIWFFNAFRTMIENKMGMTIFQRDEEGGEEQDEAAAPVVRALNENGAVGLCLDLIAIGIDEVLQNEAIKLIVGMLFKEGGARDIQGAVNTYLVKNDSVMFFKQVCATIKKLKAWHEWHDVIILEEGQDPSPPEGILLIRFLQLLSEGHYLPNQDLMCVQPSNQISHNILDELVGYLNTLSRIPCRTSTRCAISVAATILEVIQGPSAGNQAHLALNTEILEVMNRLMHANILNDCQEEEEIELKLVVVDIYSGLLEGQDAKSLIVERLLSVLHLDMIYMLAKPWKKPPEEEGVAPEDPPCDEMQTLKTECMVLLNVLCDFKPSLRDELKVDSKDNDGSTASIEVSWDGVLNRRFFHVPEISSLLAKSSKDALVADIDRSNKENKLIDFLARSADLYKEVRHQNRLVEMKISDIFSRENQQRVSTASFTLSIVMNAIFVSYYFTDPETGKPALPDSVNTAINVLNVLQIIGAAASVLINFVVNSPVIAWKHQEAGCSQLEVIVYTALDGMTIYYLWYLLFSILGMAYDNIYITFLLLDIVVKNATTRDILNAVVQPWKQLAVAFILGIFIIYIFSFFTFAYAPGSIKDAHDFSVYIDDCQSLWGCFKFHFVYGFRQGGGIGDVMEQDIGDMSWMHIAYFLVVSIAMLNIIFGIIIDTFSSLRSDKNERMRDTVEVCLICGKSKQTFDRAANSPDGFKDHIKNDHNMWSYLNFIFFIWEQDKDDDDGLEYYVRHKIDDNEITWFPLNKAMRLEQGESDHEALRNAVLADIQSTERTIMDRIQGMQSDVDVYLDKFTCAMTQDFTNNGAPSIKQGISDFLKRMDDVQDSSLVLEVEAPVPVAAADENTGAAKDQESVDDASHVSALSNPEN